MGVIGICVSPSGTVGKTSASVVIASGTRTAPTLVDSFIIKTPASENSEKIVDLARAVSSKLTGVPFTDITIRTADYFAARGAAGGNLGAHCEGAIVALLRERIVRPVVMLPGKLIAHELGLSKEQAEAEGKKFAPEHAKAGTAALSALPE